MAQVALRELGGAFPDPGLRLLLPDALSVRLGARRRSARSPPRPAAACWSGASALERAGGIAVDPRRDHRRLRAGPPPEGRGADLARLDAARAEACGPMAASGEIGRMVSRSAYAQLRYSPLLLAGTVAGMVLIFLWPPIARAFRQRPCAGGGTVRLAADGARLPADAALLPPLAALGSRPAGDRARPIRCSPCSPRWKSGAAAAGCGRAASRPWRATHDGRRRLRVGQGPSGRELPGRLLADPPGAAAADPGLLPVRARRRRCRRSCPRPAPEEKLRA